MPEGDTVLQTAARLHHVLAGQHLVRCEFRVPQLATTDLAGWLVRETIPVGKHLLIRLRAPVELPTGTARPTRDFTLHSHLMMDGMWLIRDATHPPPRDFRIRAILETSTTRALAQDVRAIALIATAAEGDLIGHLGPDLLHPDFSDADVAVALANLRRQPARTVSSALMDQRNLAGIGNIYRNETLFVAGLPHTVRVVDLPDNSLIGVIRAAHRLLDANRFRLPRSTTGLRPSRHDSVWVYSRAGHPCRRCGTPIEAATIDDAVLAVDDAGQPTARSGRPQQIRRIWWCPSCQQPRA